MLYTHIHAYTHTRIHAHTHTYAHAYTHTYAHGHARAHTHTHTRGRKISPLQSCIFEKAKGEQTRVVHFNLLKRSYGLPKGTENHELSIPLGRQARILHPPIKTKTKIFLRGPHLAAQMSMQRRRNASRRLCRLRHHACVTWRGIS